MQNNFFTLLHIQYLNHSAWNALRHEKDPNKKNKAVGLMAAYVLVAVMLMGYCFAISYGFGYLHMAELVPGYALVISSLVTAFFTFFKTNGYLFACKDNDFLLSLPFSMKAIISARFFYMYRNNLLFCMMVMLPMLAGYGFWLRPGAGVYLLWILGAVFAPLLPMACAAVIGTIIIGIGSRFRFKVLVQVILSLALILGIFFVSFSLPQMAQDGEAAFLMELGSIGQKLSEQMHQMYPVSVWFDAAISTGALLPFMKFAGVSLAGYGLFVLLTSCFYTSINTALTTSYSQSSYQMKTLRTSTALQALVKKEAKRFFSSSIYIMNMGMGLFMALLAAVACLIAGEDRILTFLQIPALGKGILPMVPFGIAMIVNMTCTTAVSLSLEGKNLWIVQSLPIDTGTLLGSKILFNLLLVLPFSVVCNILAGIAFGASALQLVLYLLTSVITVVLSSVWGMFVNLHFPNYAWENEIEVIKQGVGSMLGILGAMLGYAGCAFLVWALCLVLSGNLALLIIDFFLIAAAAFFYHSIMKTSRLG